jgi:hypothetical protein
MASAVRKLQVLNGLAQGFLVQLYNIKLLFNDAAIRPKFAHPNNAKTTKAIYAKYPDIPPLNDKVRRLLKLDVKDTYLCVKIQPLRLNLAAKAGRPNFAFRVFPALHLLRWSVEVASTIFLSIPIMISFEPLS